MGISASRTSHLHLHQVHSLPLLLLLSAPSPSWHSWHTLGIPTFFSQPLQQIRVRISYEAVFPPPPLSLYRPSHGPPANLHADPPEEERSILHATSACSDRQRGRTSTRVSLREPLIIQFLSANLVCHSSFSLSLVREKLSEMHFPRMD